GSTLKCKKGEVKTQMLYLRCGLSCRQICASNKQCRSTGCEKVSLSPDEPKTDQCVICQTTKSAASFRLFFACHLATGRNGIEEGC
ncbi:hypothetical protein MKW94_025183, partial [Papaver nudicaule]|nr:hypothetical protein [Papaver nudicaule]